MNRLYILVLGLLVSYDGFSQLPEFEWAGQCGNPPNSTDTRTSLVSGPDDSFYLSGEFQDTAWFGGKTIVSAGGTDVFLTRFDEFGESIWSLSVGAGDDEYVQEIGSDDNGNVIVAGLFYGTTLIGTDTYETYGGQDLFIAKFDQEGDFLWSERAGGAMADYLNTVNVDFDGNTIISGYFYGQISIGDTILFASAASDIYLAKFSSEGDLLWALSAGGSSSDLVYDAACDPMGNILLAGSYYYDFTIGDTTLTTVNPTGVFVSLFTPGGQLEKVFQVDGTNLTTEIVVAASSSGNYYISGNFSEQVTFGAQVFEAGEFNQDIYIAKYDPSLDLLWARHAHSFSSDQVVSLETDGYDNLFLAGHYLDTIHFDLLTLPYTLCCGSREIFIVSYSASGEVLWGEKISGTRAKVNAVTLNQQDELLLSGLFTEEMILGKLSLSNFDGFMNYVTSLKTEIFTSITTPQLSGHVKVFPNPASDQVQIKDAGLDYPMEYTLFNQYGTVVLTGKLNHANTISIASLAAGTYFLQIHNADKNKTLGSSFIKH